jgi:hypothetical protein
MISAWLVYLVLKIGVISTWLITTGAVILFITGGAVMLKLCMMADGDGDKPPASLITPPKLKKYATIGVLLCMLGGLIPDKKEMAIIYMVPVIVNSEMVQKDFPELMDLGLEALKGELNQIIDSNKPAAP